MSYIDDFEGYAKELESFANDLRFAGSQIENTVGQQKEVIDSQVQELDELRAEYEAYKVAHPEVVVIDPKFSFLVVPDTQQEVLVANDPRLKDRMTWIAANYPKAPFVIQTGDLMNWDTADHAQARIAAIALDVLEQAKIPYTFAIGNHDTQATGVGGSARDPKNTYKLQRDTTTANSFWTAADFDSIDGAYELNKIDNVYNLSEAGGKKWMVLSLEFCARPGVLTWAAKAIADHPDYNVIVATHSYLNGNTPPGLDQSNQGYGDTSGQKLWDNVLSKFPNVKLTFSGHVGYAAKSVVTTGSAGNKVYNFLTTMHDGKRNPTRIVDIDVAAKTLSTRIFCPNTNETLSAYTETVSLDLV